MFKFAGQVFGLSSTKKKSAVNQSESNVQKTSQVLSQSVFDDLNFGGKGATRPKALHLTEEARMKVSRRAAFLAGSSGNVDAEVDKLMGRLEKVAQAYIDGFLSLDDRKRQANSIVNIHRGERISMFTQNGINNGNPALRAFAGLNL